MSDESTLNFKSYQALKEELDDLLINKRKKVSDRLRAARGLGDLSDNPEQDAAKEEQRKVETRIVEIIELLKKMEIC